MPYKNEYANPYGYSSIIDNDFIKSKIKSYKPLNKWNNEKKLEDLSKRHVTELEDYIPIENINNILAVDGSVQSVNVDSLNIELGFIKISIVQESLRKMREQYDDTLVNPNYSDNVYKYYTVEDVLPGSGVSDAGLDNLDKFRYEIYDTMKNLVVYKGGPTFFEVFNKITQSSYMDVQCPYCKGTTNVGKTPTRCSHCGATMLYSTDALQLHRSFNNSFNNSGTFSEVMSTFERILMSGFLFRMKNTKSTIFITDGPLAFFRAFDIAPLILEQIQDLPVFPLLAGFEKTGQVVTFANSNAVQNTLNNGDVIMVDANAMRFISDNPREGYGKASLYGRRFIYKTLDGKKTFVFSVPPKNGEVHYKDDNWEDYPTVKTFCEMIEETKTDAFGVDTAAITPICEANDKASIPLRLGNKILTDLVEELVE